MAVTDDETAHRLMADAEQTLATMDHALRVMVRASWLRVLAGFALLYLNGAFALDYVRNWRAGTANDLQLFLGSLNAVSGAVIGWAVLRELCDWLMLGMARIRLARWLQSMREVFGQGDGK